jgi:hypothetical protein
MVMSIHPKAKYDLISSNLASISVVLSSCLDRLNFASSEFRLVAQFVV